RRVTEERWPGEDRISTTEEDEGGTEAPEADASPADAEAGEGAGEPAPPEEQLEADENGEAEQRRDGDTPVPDDEPPPGEDELPLGAMALAKTRRFACIVALGCVIRGDTPHFDYVAGEAASGLQLAALETGVPVSFGVLTLDSAGQADDRVGKGAEAVR